MMDSLSCFSFQLVLHDWLTKAVVPAILSVGTHTAKRVDNRWSLYLNEGARYSSVARVFAYGAMGRRIDPSWGGHIELFFIFRSSQCSTTGVTKAMVCVILSVE